MKTSLLSEYRKLTTTRMWWVLLIAMAAYMAFLGAVMAWSMTVTPADGSAPAIEVTDETIRSSVYATAVTFGYVFPVIIGALSVTGEFRHKTISPTFLAEPNRLRVLWAKLGAALPIGAVYGALSRRRLNKPATRPCWATARPGRHSAAPPSP